MSLAFDRWRINDLKRELDAIGCHAPLEPHGQGYKDMSPAVDIVERLVIHRKLRHGAHSARCRFMDMPGSPPATRTWPARTPSCEPRAAGCAKEKVSGGRSDRPELAKLLRRMEPSDVLDRAPRSAGALNAGPPQHPRRHRRGRGELSRWLTPGRTPRSRSFL
jgi:hypothetical protein